MHICVFNTLRPRQKGHYFADGAFKCIFLNKNVWILMKIFLKFIPKGPINNISVLVKLMGWRPPGSELLSEPIMVRLLMHTCVTQPQWINWTIMNSSIQCKNKHFIWHYVRSISYAKQNKLLTCISYNPSVLKLLQIIIPPAQRSCWGGILVSLRPSVRPSVRPAYSYGWILFILGTNDHYHERVCRAPWPLTLTYIFKVIWPWLRKSCPLCSVYSSGWILPIFGTNDHYH